MPLLQLEKKQSHTRTSQNALVVRSLCALFVGGLHFEKSPNLGRSNGILDGPFAQKFKTF